MRYLITGILLLLITSCASRKVAIAKEDTKITIDSTSVVRIDSTSNVNNNVYISENTEEFEIKPLDTTKAFIYNGKTYFNAILKHKKSNKVLVDTSKKIVSKNVLKQVSKSKQETKSIKNKTVDKKANYFVYLWLLLIPIGMYIYRKLKEKILL